MPTKTSTRPTAKRNAIAFAIIATVGSVAVALIKVLPPLFADKQAEPSKPPPAAIMPPPVAAPITVTGNGSTQTVVTGDKSTVTVQDNKRVESLLERGLAETDHPVIDLSEPIEQQVQLFAEDKVRVVGSDPGVKAIWLGHDWNTIAPIGNPELTVWGPVGTPIVPKFRGTGSLKLEISYTRYREQKRDLRPHIPGAPVPKP